VIKHRIFAAATGSLLVTVVAATAAQAAYVATGTLTGTDFGQISTIECRAAIIADASDDSARTIEVEGEECSAVSVKIYYSNSVGYVGWSNTVTHSSKAVKVLYGSDELRKSYHTATR